MKPCNSSSHKQTRFRGNQIHLPSRHLDVLTVYSSCKLKTRQEERQGMKLPLETIASYSDSFVARKINVEQKVAENGDPYCTELAVTHNTVVIKKQAENGNFTGCVFTDLSKAFDTLSQAGLL